jgi:hypothetical protein
MKRKHFRVTKEEFLLQKLVKTCLVDLQENVLLRIS